MELANQYGINLGNIYKTASDLQGADQDREIKTAQMNEYRRKELKALSDEQIAKAKLITETHGKAALYAKQNVPEGQKGQYIMQYVASQPKEVQDAFAQKYGTDPAQIEAKIPFMLNDIISVDKELEAVQKEKEAKQKHAYALEEEGVKGAIQYGKEELKQTGEAKLEGVKQGNRMSLNAFTQGEATKREQIREQGRQNRYTPPEPTGTKERRIKVAEERESRLSKSSRLKDADLVLGNITGYDDLSDQDRRDAKKFYIDTGKIPGIQKVAGTFGDSYKVKRQEKKKAKQPLDINKYTK